MKKTLRIPYTEVAHLVKQRKIKPQTKLLARSYEELTTEQQEFTQKFLKNAREVLPDCEVFLGGSQISGRWDEASDYDFYIHTDCSLSEKALLKNLQFEKKVDIFFSSKTEKHSLFLVKIPDKYINE